MIFHRVDDWLIDRCFQAVSDHFARFVSCYGIAAFLMTGFVLEHAAFYLYRETYVWIAVSAMWSIPILLRAYKLDRDAPRNVMPIERVRYFFSRISDVFIITPMAIVMFWDAGDSARRIDAAAWLLVLPAEYFLACRKRPPRELRATAPAGALTQGS